MAAIVSLSASVIAGVGPLSVTGGLTADSNAPVVLDTAMAIIGDADDDRFFTKFIVDNSAGKFELITAGNSVNQSWFKIREATILGGSVFMDFNKSLTALVIDLTEIVAPEIAAILSP